MAEKLDVSGELSGGDGRIIAACRALALLLGEKTRIVGCLLRDDVGVSARVIGEASGVFASGVFCLRGVRVRPLGGLRCGQLAVCAGLSVGDGGVGLRLLGRTVRVDTRLSVVNRRRRDDRRRGRGRRRWWVGGDGQRLRCGGRVVRRVDCLFLVDLGVGERVYSRRFAHFVRRRVGERLLGRRGKRRDRGQRLTAMAQLKMRS